MKELTTSWVSLNGWKITFDRISKDFVKGKFQHIKGKPNSFSGIINDKLALCFIVELPEDPKNPPYLFSFEGKFLTKSTIIKLSLICCITNLKTMKSHNVDLIFYKKDYIPEDIIQLKT